MGYLKTTHLTGGENNGGNLGAISPLGQEGHSEGLGEDSHGKVGGTTALGTAPTALRIIHQRSIHITVQLKIETNC